MKEQPSNYFLIVMTFLIGFLLTIMPLPQWAIWLRPQWTFSLLLFWVIAIPSQCGIALAWTMGVCMDLLTGTSLGQHAAVFVLLVYIMLKCCSMIAHFPLMQQTVTIAIFAYFNVFLQGLILGWTGHSTHIALDSLSAMTTGLIWPWMMIWLNHLRPRKLIR